MIINGIFTNGGQIPAHGNEKSAEQLISELSKKNRDMRRILNNIINSYDSKNESALLKEIEYARMELY